jgi:acetolactate synthase I/II/III large subunit
MSNASKMPAAGVNARHGGKILADQLAIQGVKTVYTVPGESFLAALDGLYDHPEIQTVICRQEGGASMMAEAAGKMTGKPGILFVTRGPGAANAMSGLHVAQQDSTPMIMFLGLPGAEHEDREAFQEIDVKGVFGTFVKWTAVIRTAERIPEYVSRAFHVAMSGRPGPVVIGLPEDMLSALGHAVDAKPARVAEAGVDVADFEALTDKLLQAKRPLMIVGGPGWSSKVQKSIEAFATAWDMPVASAFRYQDYFDNRHKNYVGHVGIGPDAKLAAAVRDADMLFVVGARMGEMTTSGYTLLDIPNPKQFLIHAHPSPDELGTVYSPDMSLVTSAEALAQSLGAGWTLPSKMPWAEHRASLRAAYEASMKPLPTPGAVQLEQVLTQISAMLPEDAIVTNGAGNYAAFLHRYFTYKGYRTQLSPTSGSMGYGLPAAIAAKIAEPSKTVVAFAGDGCFMMCCQELATAVQYGANVITIIANNSTFGTIRMHQEKTYPGRVSGTTLVNPDFAAFARSFGAHGERVLTTAEFKPAFERALASGKPAVIELVTEAEALTARQTLSQIRAAAAK